MIIAGNKQRFDRMRFKVRARRLCKAVHRPRAAMDRSRRRTDLNIGAKEFAQRPSFAATKDIDFSTKPRPSHREPNGNAFRASEREIMEHDADAHVYGPPKRMDDQCAWRATGLIDSPER